MIHIQVSGRKWLSQRNEIAKALSVEGGPEMPIWNNGKMLIEERQVKLKKRFRKSVSVFIHPRVVPNTYKIIIAMERKI